MSGTNGRRSEKGSGSSRTGKSLHFTIPSVLAAGLDVQKEILQIAQRSGFDDDSVFAIRLALEEALINAIKHGNRLDPAKSVKIDASISPKRAEIVIEDEGPGFDRGTVADPTSDENLCKLHGRGILLMESYMSRVEWSRGGRRVRMVKNKP